MTVQMPGPWMGGWWGEGEAKKYTTTTTCWGGDISYSSLFNGSTASSHRSVEPLEDVLESVRGNVQIDRGCGSSSVSVWRTRCTAKSGPWVGRVTMLYCGFGKLLASGTAAGRTA